MNNNYHNKMNNNSLLNEAHESAKQTFITCLLKQHPLTRISVIGRAITLMLTLLQISVALALIIVLRDHEEEEDFLHINILTII